MKTKAYAQLSLSSCSYATTVKSYRRVILKAIAEIHFTKKPLNRRKKTKLESSIKSQSFTASLKHLFMFSNTWQIQQTCNKKLTDSQQCIKATLSASQKVSLTQHREENYQVLGEIRISFGGLPFISVIKLILKEKIYTIYCLQKV